MIRNLNTRLLLIFICMIVLFNPLASYASDKSTPSARTEVHDFVIVGGGTSGLTLGYLLAKDGFDVVVLEAGADKDDDDNITKPKPIGALEKGWRNEYFWTADGKPQTNLPNDEAHYSGGRLLGGSSSVNDSIYWRGTLKTYARWGGLFAKSRYVRNVFVASETYNGSTQNGSARGRNGPFQVTQVFPSPIGQIWVSAMRDVLINEYGLDVPVVDDLHVVNGPAFSSQAQIFVDPKNFNRVSSSRALLKERNSELDVRLKATVTKILIEDKKAYAVRYIQAGVSKEMHARKKVILSAGIHSSKLLQLSGVGDAAELRAAKVNVIYDNPEVGKNLTNHVLLLVVSRVNATDNTEISRNLAFKQVAGIGVIPDPTNQGQKDLHLEFATINPAPGIAAFAIILVAPESRGFQKIVSNDPLSPLVVDFNYLSSSIDRDRLVTGLKIVKKTIEKIAVNDPSYEIISDISNPLEYVTQNATHIHHFSGTSAIGKVVDKHLNVIGIKNLMVADVSVSPTIVRGHTYAAAILIGAVAYSEISGNKKVSFE